MTKAHASTMTAPWEQCTCGQTHHPGASYYVSVTNDSDIRLAAGPFATHAQALAWVRPVNDLVVERYNPDGRAHWYGYGTTAMARTYRTPGVLNPQLGLGGTHGLGA